MGISERLLVHTATAYAKAGFDADRNVIYGDGTELSCVRFTKTNGQANGGYGLEAKDSLLMFYDCENSCPKGFTPENGMRVDFDGKTYTVMSVQTVYAEKNTPHHYEVTMV